MTECIYTEPLTSFTLNINPKPVEIVPLLEEGYAALEKINKGMHNFVLIYSILMHELELGLAFDEQDMKLYMEILKSRGKNPTNVEIFDIAQSNSEHSR